MIGRGTLAAATLGTALLLSACGTDTTTGAAPVSGDRAGTLPPPPTTVAVDAVADIEIPDDAIDWRGQAAVTVTTRDNAFNERVIVVSPGTQITWRNDGTNTHNVLPSIEEQFEGISRVDLEAGESASRVFDQVGDFPYYCSLHGTATRGQTGRILVLEAAE